MAKNNREKHLLEAILHLLLYIGDGEIPKNMKALKGIFYSGSNPSTDYSRSKVMIAG